VHSAELVHFARAVTGGVFIAAAFAKWWDRSSFEDALAGFGLRSARVIVSIALALPAVEALLAAGLLIPQSGPLASWCAIVGVTAATASAVFRYSRSGEFQCHCFGTIAPTGNFRTLLLRNTLLVVVAAVGTRNLSAPSDIGEWTLLTLAAFATVVAGFIIGHVAHLWPAASWGREHLQEMLDAREIQMRVMRVVR
jgi:hypothetical protein